MDVISKDYQLLNERELREKEGWAEESVFFGTPSPFSVFASFYARKKALNGMNKLLTSFIFLKRRKFSANNGSLKRA